ncbi:unnamed protein product, partial [Prorocentrum cordatum]
DACRVPGVDPCVLTLPRPGAAGAVACRLGAFDALRGARGLLRGARSRGGMMTFGPSQSAITATCVDVPTWNGSAETLTSYKFKVAMFTKSISVADRHVCGPQGTGEIVQDWAAGFEKKERATASQGEIAAAAGGDSDYGKVYKSLLARFPAEALAEISGKWRRDKPFYEEDADDLEEEIGGCHDEFHGVVEQLINLVDVEEDEDPAIDGHNVDTKVFAEFELAGRGFMGARDLLRGLRVSRDSHPVVATKDGQQWRSPPPPAPGRGHFRPGRGASAGSGIEGLMYEMLDQHHVEFETDSGSCSFTFGNGLQKSSMGTASGGAFLGGELVKISLSVMPNCVPIILGMDILTDALNVVVDRGRMRIGPPALDDGALCCDRLSGKRVAVNLSTPQCGRVERPKVVMDNCDASAGSGSAGKPRASDGGQPGGAWGPCDLGDDSGGASVQPSIERSGNDATEERVLVLGDVLEFQGGGEFTAEMLDDSDMAGMFCECHDQVMGEIYTSVAEDLAEVSKPHRVDFMEVCCPEVPGLSKVVQTAYYPLALFKAWTQHILRENVSVQCGMEIFAGLGQMPEDAGGELADSLGEHLQLGDADAVDEEANVKGLRISETPTKKEELEIEQRLMGLHRNLGHPSNKTSCKILKASGAPVQVLRGALRLQCHGCHAGQLPNAARVASGIELPGVLEVLASDGLEWPTGYWVGVAGMPVPSSLFAIVDGGAGETQARRRVDGRARPTSVTWISHGCVLLRCAPEQLRAASEAEKMIAELQRQTNLDKTMTEILETAKAGTCEDLLGQGGAACSASGAAARGGSRPRWRVARRGPEMDLHVAPDEEMNKAMEDQSNLLVDLSHDKLDIALDSDGEQTAYFECLVDENTTPDGQQGLMNHILDSDVANQRRKDKVELNLSKMNPSEREEFEGAIAKGTSDGVQQQGLRPVPITRVKGAADVVRGKARLVLLGYQTKDLVQEPTASPTACRLTSWTVISIEPDVVLKKPFQVKDGEILQVVKPGYGIGEAPRHKWETVKGDFAKLGTQACELEPCLWKARCPQTGSLVGVAMARVGDFILAGDASRPEWRAMVQQTRGLYTWDALLDADKTVPRAVCGEVYWVADLQSKVPTGARGLFAAANHVVKLVKQSRRVGLQICRRDLNDLALFAWRDVARASRPGGRSQGGRVTAAVSAAAAGGKLSEFTVLDWACRKLRRVARLSLAEEVQGAGGAEGEQCMVRLVLAEVLRDKSPLWERTVSPRRLPAILVTDCRAFYDGVVRSQSAGSGLEEWRAAGEASALRDALGEGQTKVCWVRSRAQIADCPAKASWQAIGVIRAFLEKQQWRLIYDEQFASAQKRAALGKGTFDEVRTTDSQKGIAESERNSTAMVTSDYLIVIQKLQQVVESSKARAGGFFPDNEIGGRRSDRAGVHCHSVQYNLCSIIDVAIPADIILASDDDTSKVDLILELCDSDWGAGRRGQ